MMDGILAGGEVMGQKEEAEEGCLGGAVWSPAREPDGPGFHENVMYV